VILFGVLSGAPTASAAGSSCISLGYPSVVSSSTSIQMTVSVTSSCKAPFGLSGGGPVYSILGESSLSSSCSGPYDYSLLSYGTITCRISLGGSLGSSRIGATSSTLQIWFAYDSSTKQVTFSHSAIPSSSSGGSSSSSSGGTAAPVTPSCSSAPGIPNLTIEWNAIGPKFNFSPSATGQKATALFWSYSLWNSITRNWEDWVDWKKENPSTGSYQATPQTGKTKIAFGVQAANACGASAVARERDDLTGIPLTPKQQDAISRNITASPDLKVGFDADLYQLAESKLNLDLLAKSQTPAICSVNQTQVIFNEAGLCRLLVSSVTEQYEFGAEPTEISFEITKKVSQNIPEINLNSSYYLSTKNVELSLRTDAALTVRFKSLSPKICQVLGSTLAFVSTGSCILEASQEGDTSTLPAPVRNFEIWIDSDPIKTLTCMKGKLTKKVTGVNPKCPAGYKVKK